MFNCSTWVRNTLSWIFWIAFESNFTGNTFSLICVIIHSTFVSQAIGNTSGQILSWSKSFSANSTLTNISIWYQAIGHCISYTLRFVSIERIAILTSLAFVWNVLACHISTFCERCWHTSFPIQRKSIVFNAYFTT